MKGIKNILFDMGGVLIDLDRMRCVRAFQTLGFSDIEQYLGDYGQKGAFMELEDGTIDLPTFYNRIREHIPHSTDKEITDAFMQFIVGLPIYKLQMLRKLKSKGYRLLLLSNTNPLMYPILVETLFTQEGKNIHDYFDDIFLSYELGAIKPDAVIFKKVIEQSGINPEETLFIDDSQANLDASIPFGFETFLAPQNTDFSSIFNL